MLKKCLLGLFVGFVGFIGFSNGGRVSYGGECSQSYDNSFTTHPCTDYIDLHGNTLFSLHVYSNFDDTVQIVFFDSNGDYVDFNNFTCQPYKDCEQVVQVPSGATKFLLGYGDIYSVGSFLVASFYDQNFNGVGLQNFNLLSSSGGGDQSCPEINTGDILSGSCDINYCVENDLCPTSSGSWSELVINDIVHEGKPLINLFIPDSIYWDYTGNDNEYNIYVGSGYDQDYIDSILKINSYRPDNEDFTNIFVSGLTLIFPYIFVALLIVFMWKLLKRVFK